VAATISQRSRCDGNWRSARNVCPASSALSNTSATMPPGRFPASVAELDQNTTIISAMNTAKMRPKTHSSVAWYRPVGRLGRVT
jgi:hypothetical protein